ncbi:MAG TPA: acetyl-CoA C-acetyltransferase, partial [Terriglobales bacterium]|nr:acetyl-CoA C-acetyltransferase [Terriglobales bacterium]
IMKGCARDDAVVRVLQVCASPPAPSEVFMDDVVIGSGKLPVGKVEFPPALEDVVIVSAVRTPIAKFQGALTDFTAPQLGAMVVKEVVKRANLDPTRVDECIMGNVISAGLGQNPARQAALNGGLPPEVAALTINKVCGSGLKAVGLAAQAIQTGNAEILVAGGMESMTNAPYLLPQARKGYRLGNSQIIDSMVNDGLWDVYNNYHMGMTGENVAEKYGITREQQDEFAVNSHRKAVQAWKECRFKSQVMPVEIPGRKKGEPPTIFDKDEGPREDTTAETLRALKPAFKKDGSVTAGNASTINDGAAALVVMSARKARQLGLQPMARIVAQATSGIDPKWVMMAPVDGIRNLWKKTGWKPDEVDLYEINEAFSVQSVAVVRELGIDMDRVNVNGGAVALGHPIGASGARVLITLLYELIRRNAHKGIAALCLGGGNSVAMAIER